MRRYSIAVAFIAALVAPATSVAQDTGPRSGTWGAETNMGNDVSLLRFRSSSSAWLVGFSGLWLRRDEEDDTFDSDLTAVTLRLGLRRYRSSEMRFRPFTTLAALAAYVDGTASPPWQFGAQFEYGGAYFFNPHVSLGASFDIRGLIGMGTREQPFQDEVGVTEMTISTGLRFLGAVYF